MLMACRLLKEQKQKTKSEEIVASLVNYPGLISYKFNLIFFEYQLLLSKGQLKSFVSKFDFIQTFLIKLYKQDKSLSRFFSLIFSFSRGCHFGMTNYSFFRLGSGSLLRHRTGSLHRYRLHHIPLLVPTQSFPEIGRPILPFHDGVIT